MIWVTKWILLVVVSTAAASAWAIDERAARDAATAFLAHVLPNMDPSELASLSAQRRGASANSIYAWSVQTRWHSLSVDDDSGQVTSYSDPRLYGRAMGGPDSRGAPQAGPPFYHSQQELIARAGAILDGLGWHRGPDVTFGHGAPAPADRHGKVSRSIIYLQFDDRPNGFPTNGNGNMSLIGLNSLTADIAELMRECEDEAR